MELKLRQQHLAWALMLVTGQACAASAIAVFNKMDPWVWIIGGMGAAIIYVKNPPTSKSDAIVNSLISVLIGGLVAPTASAYCGSHYDKSLDSPYPFAFVFSAGWPWIIPILLRRMRSRRDNELIEAVEKIEEARKEKT